MKNTERKVVRAGAAVSLMALAVLAAGCAGAIVGRALYEGRIDLASLMAGLRVLDQA